MLIVSKSVRFNFLETSGSVIDLHRDSLTFALPLCSLCFVTGTGMVLYGFILKNSNSKSRNLPDGFMASVRSSQKEKT